jgi:DNA-binding IclR family transcriptional regulator
VTVRRQRAGSGPNPEPTAPGSPLGRRLRMIVAVGEHEAATGGTLGVVELAELMRREKTQVSRGLRALQAADVLERDDATLGYRLGPRLFQLATAAGDPALLHAARPVVSTLAQQVRERAQLAVLLGADALTVESVSPDAALQAASGLGRSASACTTCAGRALLLDHDAGELSALFGRTRARALRALLDHARAAGYVRVDDDPEPGLLGLAAPVRRGNGAIVAALEISAPSVRLISGVANAARLLRRAAERLSAVQGDGRDSA